MHTDPQSRSPQPPNSPDADRRLSTLLRSWQVDTASPPGFADSVWRRIQIAGSATDSPPNLGAFLWNWLTRGLARPRVALAYLGVIFLVGAGAGALGGQVRSESAADGLQGRYVRSIDPFIAGVLR